MGERDPLGTQFGKGRHRGAAHAVPTSTTAVDAVDDRRDVAA